MFDFQEERNRLQVNQEKEEVYQQREDERYDHPKD